MYVEIFPIYNLYREDGGEGIIITPHAKLHVYVGMLVTQTPIVRD